MSLETTINHLRSLSDPNAVKGMARFGINPKHTFGISIPELRRIAKQIGSNHLLALGLWKSGVHEARILASMIDDPERVTEDQMDDWAEDFDSWDVCDQCCGNLFDRTRFAHKKAVQWSSRSEEFVKRAGFALMAALAVHDKEMPDARFLRFLPLIKRQSMDERNFVKKAVNWALRQVGKRNTRLNQAAIAVAKQIHELDSKSARWVASDALRELESTAVQAKLRKVRLK